MSAQKKLSIRMSRRFSKSERPEDLYQAAYEELERLPQPWGLAGLPMKKMPDYEGKHSVGISYTKQVKTSPIKGFHIGYQNRNRKDDPDDEPANDDRLTIEFYPNKVQEPWRYLMETVFPTYIKAMRPYLGKMYDVDLATADMGTPNFDTGEFYENPDYVQSRKGIYRIWPANYWDSDLCRRAFNLTPEEIVKRVKDQVATCEVFEHGVLLIYSNEQMSIEEILNINSVLIPLFKSPRSSD